MATCIKRFRAYSPGRPCALRACGHAHFACVAVKVAILLFFGSASILLTLADARGNSFVQFDYNVSSTTRARSTVFIELYDSDRPLTTANFLQYVNGGLYNSSLMHQLAVSAGAAAVLRGGGYYPQYLDEPATTLQKSLNPNFKVDLDSNYATPNPTVNSEFNNAPLRSNVKGTIGMWRPSGSDPNSASNEYYFNLVDNSVFLDFQAGGLTVFAKVTGDGMSLIDLYASQLPIWNLNPDTNDDGTPDAGPFDKVPILFGSSSFIPLIVNQAKVVDYLGNGIVTDVGSGWTPTKDVFIDTGASFTGTGNITIGANRRLGVRENYVIDRTVVNHGTLAPGLSLGVIGIASPYFQFSDGTLNIQLGGTTADTLYDKLSTNSTAFLAGKLQVLLTNGFTPALGNSFTILSAASIVGSFNAFELPLLASGQAWKIAQSATTISLTVVMGDYNRNGVVDAADYVVWRKTRNTSITAWSGADGNGDGVVNDADFTVWRNNVGAIGGGIHGAGASDLAISSVPEPTSGLFIFSAYLLLARLPHRRRTNL